MRKIIIYFIGCMINVLPILPLYAQSSQEQTQYSQHLQSFLKQAKAYIELPVQLPQDTQKFTEAVNTFQNFSQQYPQSVFNDDITFMVICIRFVDAVLAQEWDQADTGIHDMNAFLMQNPDFSLEERTIFFGKRILGKQVVLAFLAIPQASIIAFMKGWRAWAKKDYPHVIEHLLPVKDTVLYDKDETGTAARLIYEALTTAYLRQGKKTQAQELARQAFARFPDNRMLRESMRKVEKDCKL